MLKQCGWAVRAVSCVVGNPAHLAQYFCNLGSHLLWQRMSKELRLGFITLVLKKLEESVCMYICVHAHTHMHMFSFSCLLRRHALPLYVGTCFQDRSIGTWVSVIGKISLSENYQAFLLIHFTSQSTLWCCKRYINSSVSELDDSWKTT